MTVAGIRGWALRAVLAGVALFSAVAPSGADELKGTLKKVKSSASITLGYREASLPFSFLNQEGKAIGYSIDLCNEVV
jgi:glutamate/aspartate transport system substrate-binding protein